MAVKRVDASTQYKVIVESDSAVISETREELAELEKAGAPTRYEQYVESDFDESKLKLDPAEEPTRFVIRPLLNVELSAIQNKFMEVDTATKKMKVSNGTLMALEAFDLGCLGLIGADGKIQKVKSSEFGFGVAVSIGSVITTITTLGKHLKNA